MTIAQMLQQSAVLTLLGMIVVFAFLWLMIICVNAVGKLVHLLAWDKDLRPQEEKLKKSAGAAVTQYRKGEPRAKGSAEGSHE
jgi:oxaloacetate decarboxylase gamma subunit